MGIRCGLSLGRAELFIQIFKKKKMKEKKHKDGPVAMNDKRR